MFFKQNSVILKIKIYFLHLNSNNQQITMIFYGTKGAHLKSKKINGVKCGHCGEQLSHTISVYGKYFYIYWIPIFPLGKKVISECDHCKATSDRKEMSEPLKLAADNVKREVKTPITYWIGSLIIAGLIAFGVYASSQHKKDLVTFINAPAANDIIEYKSSDDGYSTLKITKVTADSVYVVANTMEISRKSKLYKIDKEENYDAERFSLSLADYKAKFDSKDFLDVER